MIGYLAPPDVGRQFLREPTHVDLCYAPLGRRERGAAIDLMVQRSQ